MGQGTSKSPGGTTEHVFRSDTPVNFSPDLLNALQASPEVETLSPPFPRFLPTLSPQAIVLTPAHMIQSDTTRALDLELQIQKRVHEELTRLSDSASATLAELSEQISATPDISTASQDTAATDSFSSSAPAGSERAAKDEHEHFRDLGRASVAREIDGLKEKLKGRRLTEGVVGDAAGVRTVKDKLVRCLKENDRRPLDCWREVEEFKSEVARLEKGFLGKVME